MPSVTSAKLADTLRQGIEACNVDLILRCFTEDAELNIVDRNHPPSAPLRVNGKQAIGDYYKDVCSREMNHRIDQAIVGDDEIALREACEYADGSHVLASGMFELSDGKIFRGTTVQAWDE